MRAASFTAAVSNFFGKAGTLKLNPRKRKGKEEESAITNSLRKYELNQVRMPTTKIISKTIWLEINKLPNKWWITAKTKNYIYFRIKQKGRICSPTSLQRKC